jgi:hypothetical protein
VYEQIGRELQILRWRKHIPLQLGTHVPDFNNPSYIPLLFIKEGLKYWKSKWEARTCNGFSYDYMKKNMMTSRR